MNRRQFLRSLLGATVAIPGAGAIKKLVGIAAVGSVPTYKGHPIKFIDSPDGIDPTLEIPWRSIHQTFEARELIPDWPECGHFFNVEGGTIRQMIDYGERDDDRKAIRTMFRAIEDAEDADAIRERIVLHIPTEQVLVKAVR